MVSCPDLTHVDYPEGLLPVEFIPIARDVIAKVRYPELKAQLEEMKSQMANMPEAMQGMIATQVERLEAMIGEGGGIEVTMTVKSVKVNAGPPGGG